MSGCAVRGDRAIVLLTLGLLGAGFLGDGTARYASAKMPSAWSPSGPFVWNTPLAAWGNAGPVLMGDLVCATEEPVSVVCLERTTGKVRWRAAHDVVSTLPASEQAALRTKVGAYEARAAEIPALLREQGQLRKDLRRAGAEAPADAVSRLEAISRTIFELQALKNELARYLTPPDQDQIGWATPTPVSDGSSLWVHFANGVVTKHDRAGATVWTRWLGEAPREPMNGYTFGTTASSVLVGGVLIVPFGDLHGLDAATGKTLWTVPRWRDYGSPTPVTVAGVRYLATPDGRVVRAQDGVVVLEGLPTTPFNSVMVQGTDLYTASSKGPHGGKEFTVSRVSLTPGGAHGVQSAVKWSRLVTARDRVYATPQVLGDRLIVVDSQGTLLTFDTATGADAGTINLPSNSPGHYSTPVVMGAQLLVSSERGITSFVSLTPSLTVTGTAEAEGQRSTALVDGNRVYLRTVRGVIAVGN